MKVVNGVSDAEVLRIMTAVKHHIRRNPEQYDQNEFRKIFREGRECGTQCCIAGHVDIIANGERAYLNRENLRDILFAAKYALGNRENLSRLFWVNIDHTWPSEVGDFHLWGCHNNPTAEDGCKAIDWWLRSVGIDPEGKPALGRPKAPA